MHRGLCGHALTTSVGKEDGPLLEPRPRRALHPRTAFSLVCHEAGQQGGEEGETLQLMAHLHHGPGGPRRQRRAKTPNPQGPCLVLCPPLRKGPDGSGDQRGSPRNTYKDWGTQAPAVLGWVRGESEGTSSAVLNN